MRLKLTVLVASLGLMASSGFALSVESPVQLDAYALSANTPSCDASLVVNGAVESHTIKQGDCETVKGPSSTIDPQVLEAGPLSVQLHNADSKTLRDYSDSIPATAYANIVAELKDGGHQHQSITINYPYKQDSTACSHTGEISDVFQTIQHEFIELCYAGY